MDAGTYVALGGVAVALVTALTVPMLTFRLAVRQDQARWLRDQRVQLYLDLLTDAQARHEDTLWPLLSENMPKLMAERSESQKLTAAQRAALRARAALFASQHVDAELQLFDDVLTEARGVGRADPSRVVAAMEQMTRAREDLQNAIRREVGVERMHLDGRRLPGKPRRAPAP